MSKKVLGVYNTSDEVIQAIEGFRNEGYSVRNLTVMSNTRDFPSSIQSETGVSTEDLSGTGHARVEDHKGFLDSLVSAFEDNNTTNQGDTSSYNQLVSLGIDETAAKEYEGELHSGKILLLAANGSGSLAGYSIASNESNVIGTDPLDADKEHSLKLREEQLNVSKDIVQTGEVEVRKDVVEEQKTVHVPVTHEEVYVERRPVDGSATNTTTPIGDEETIRVPIVEEKVEVTKKPVVTEEIVIGKRQVTETEQVTENIKREKARVGKDGNARVDESTVVPNLRNNNQL